MNKKKHFFLELVYEPKYIPIWHLPSKLYHWGHARLIILKSWKKCVIYHIATTKDQMVASSSLSQLVAHVWIFRLFMKGKFDAYVLWPLTKRVQNWIVDRSTAHNFTVCKLNTVLCIYNFDKEVIRKENKKGDTLFRPNQCQNLFFKPLEASMIIAP